MSHPSALDADLLAGVDAALAADDQQRSTDRPSRRRSRQPVHTVYVPAHRFSLGTVSEWGLAALRALESHGPLPDGLGPLVKAKLLAEPIEDLRIDFAGGCRDRSDAEQDADAVAAGRSLSALLGIKGAPAFCGIRFASLAAADRRRGIRTLDLFLGSMLSSGSRLPAGFRLTLPRVASVAQVSALVTLCEALEKAYEIDRLRFELQLDGPGAVLASDGVVTVAPMIRAAGSRCVGVHYPAAGNQDPVSEYARTALQVAAAAAGLPVSGGSAEVLPAVAGQAWNQHAEHVRHCLERGFYQGYDLHPTQLPARFAATFGFFRDGYVLAGQRLRALLDRALPDQSETVYASADLLIRARDCGAISEAELIEAAGLDRAGLLALFDQR